VRPVLPCHVHERTRAIRLVHGRIKAIPHYVPSRERAICPRGNASSRDEMPAGMRAGSDGRRPFKARKTRILASSGIARNIDSYGESGLYIIFIMPAHRDRDCDSRGGG